MKSLVLILILILNVMCLNLMSQSSVYSPNGTNKPFKSEDIDIKFTKTDIVFPSEKADDKFAPILLAMLPTLVDMGFQLTTSILEKKAKDFSAEYTKSKSYLGAGEKNIPDFEFVRTVVLENDTITALSIIFKASQVHKMEGFVYYIDAINLKYSSAKATSKANTFDYCIEIKPTLLINNEKKVIELSPIAISSVKFDGMRYELLKHRTDIIPMPKGAILTEMSLKIVESNPVKVRAEKILSEWNKYKDNTKTIINNILPKEK